MGLDKPYMSKNASCVYAKFVSKLYSPAYWHAHSGAEA